jgi:hypothetical protein
MAPVTVERRTIVPSVTCTELRTARMSLPHARVGARNDARAGMMRAWISDPVEKFQPPGKCSTGRAIGFEKPALARSGSRR